MRAAARLFVFLCGALAAFAALGSVGIAQLAGQQGDGPVTVFYPTAAAERTVKRGPFTFQLAEEAAPEKGNGRLVVISHGSGGSALVHEQLSRALVAAGFVVALPEHRGDNYRDMSLVGPASWKLRPMEVSRAIDAVAADERFAPLLELDKVGMFGMSAGGHTALTLAGGRWSPSRFAQHCQEDIDEDFYACVGLATRKSDGLLGWFKEKIALMVIQTRLSDPSWYQYRDPRIAAVVADVPYAADFDLASLAKPPVPLALVLSEKDQWLVPRFHGKAVLAACGSCELIADLPNAGHGALLAPPPPNLTGLAGELLNDPPGFDRSVLPAVEGKIVAFFRKILR